MNGNVTEAAATCCSVEGCCTVEGCLEGCSVRGGLQREWKRDGRKSVEGCSVNGNETEEKETCCPV